MECNQQKFRPCSATEVKSRLLQYAGCVDGRETFTGPRRAEIFPTNRCNLDCLACWSFSPLLEGRHLPPPLELEWDSTRQLITDLAQLDCEEIQLVGGGEPMIYPQIMPAIELIKALKMRCFITTNLTPVTEKRARRIVEIGVDRLYCSLWAASPETYRATHPNSSEKTFPKIDRTLRLIQELKGGCRLAKPQVILHNVIFKQNHHEVERMVEYALEVGATAVQLTMPYTFPGSTDVLLLDAKMRQEVLRQIKRIPEDIRALPGHHGPGSFLWEFDNFRRRLEQPQAGEGQYDKDILERLPCQIGWFYTIVQADGQVIPCCKGQSKPMGNIHEKSFREIWDSETYKEFRHKAKTLPKSDPYFTSINCHKMCDNIAMLDKIENHMQRLKPAEGLTHRLVVPVLKAIKNRRKRRSGK